MGRAPRRKQAGRSALALVLLATVLAIAGLGSTPAGALPVTFRATPVASDMVDGEGLAVLQVGSTVYVGGTFSTVRSQSGATVAARANLAAFSVSTGHLITAFQADTNGPVRALATDGTRLYVGGSYTTIGGVNRSRLAAVSLATGAVDGSFRSDTNSNVYSVARYLNRLVVGGSFSTIGGQARSRFAVLDSATGAVLSPAPSFPATVNAVGATPDGSRLFAGGGFTTVNGVARQYAAVLDGAGALASVQLKDLNGPPSAFTTSADGAYVYASLTGSPNTGTRWRMSDGTRLWVQRCDGDAQAIDEYAGTVYTGFHEACDGDTTIRLTANDAVSGARDTTFKPSFDKFWGVRSIDAAAAGLAIAGDFTNVAGVPAQGFAIFPPLATTTTTTTSTTTTAPTTTTTTTTTAPTTTTTTTPVAQEIPFALKSGSWRYLDGANVAPTAWNTLAFDDSAWKTGVGELGYGDGDEATVISYGPSASNKAITSWFRRKFSVATIPAAGLKLQITADDGAVIYLNGVEVNRQNMPTGAITPTTLAATARDGLNESTPRSVTISSAALRVGQNVVAVEVHQAVVTTSDCSFDLAISPA